MKLLLFSDIHRDLDASQNLVTMAADADVAVGAGDFGVMREGLDPVMSILSEMKIPAVLVPGNGESDRELSQACTTAGWQDAHVLHGSGVDIGEEHFWGIGGGIPITPFGDWSWDLSSQDAAELLTDCPPECILVSHSPPHGHVDLSNGRHIGSRAILEAVERTRPKLVVCGHIHSCWRQESRIGDTRVINVGPQGMIVEI